MKITKIHKVVAGAVLGLLLSAPVSADCPWDTIIDTKKWYNSYKVPEARMIYLRQVVDGRYLIYDNYDIVVDVKTVKVNNIYKGQELAQLTRFIGRPKGDYGSVSFTRLDGFSEEKARYVPILDMYKYVYKYCTHKEVEKVMLNYDVRD